MERKIVKSAAIVISLIIALLVLWFAKDVFLLAFAAILLAILLNAIGRGTQQLIKLPYPLALTLAMIAILGLLTLTFWLYTPLISEQLRLLIDQLPGSIEAVSKNIAPYFGKNFFTSETIQKKLSLSNEKVFNQAVTVFSFTIGSIISFIIFLIIGLYLALYPKRYIQWFLFLIPYKNRDRTKEIMNRIDHSLRWWIVGKLLSMAVVGVTTFIGLKLLNVSLAFILGLLAALLTFIPYVGAILSAVPALLVAFTQSPLLALYVAILYVGIHLVEGYFITPSIEQRTVSIPPAITILVQILMLTLIGVVGFALATPLAVLGIALVHEFQSKRLT